MTSTDQLKPFEEKLTVNEGANSRRANISAAFQEWEVPNGSPIDRYYGEVDKANAFYTRVRHAVTLPGSTLSEDDVTLLGEMVFLRHVTAFEDYLKLVIGTSVSRLPCCRERSYTQFIQLHSAYSYPLEEIGLGVVEGKTFSSADQIISAFDTYLDIRLKVPKALGTTIDLGTLWEDLDLVLQLRHSLVHSLGILSAHDSLKARARDKVGQRVYITSDILYDCVNVINRSVRAINQTVFTLIECRWWTTRRLTGEFSRDKDKFYQLLNIFWSTRDKGALDLESAYVQSRDFWYPRVLRALAKETKHKAEEQEAPRESSTAS